VIAVGAVVSVLSAIAIWSVVAPPKLEAAPAATSAPAPTATMTSAPAVTASAIAPAESTTVYMNPTERKPDPRGSVFVRASALAKSGDLAAARLVLEPRVFGTSHATDDEVHLLRAICNSLHDTKCLAGITWRYAE
jgi:hypothetical protein